MLRLPRPGSDPLHDEPASMRPDARQVLISVNPKSGARSSGGRVDHLTDLLQAEGLQVMRSSDLAEVSDIANKLHSTGQLRALVAVGGDGTAAELVNRTAAGVPLTILPAGNENLLARYLSLGNDPETVCRTIVEGALLRLDAGLANGRIFLLMIGCGFDGEVVRRVDQRRTGHIRSRSYIKPILASIRSYQYPPMRVYWDDEDVDRTETGAGSAETRWLFAFNLPCYGGGLGLAPQADGSDGLLDVCAFHRGSWWHGLRYVTAVLLGRHQRLADCTMRRVRRMRITADAPVPYQLDGDPGGYLPVDVEVLPGRLTLVVPRRAAAAESPE